MQKTILEKLTLQKLLLMVIGGLITFLSILTARSTSPQISKPVESAPCAQVKIVEVVITQKPTPTPTKIASPSASISPKKAIAPNIQK